MKIAIKSQIVLKKSQKRANRFYLKARKISQTLFVVLLFLCSKNYT